MKNIITSLLLALAATAAFAECQGNRMTVSQELHESGSTIVGTVQAATPVPDSSFHLDGVNYVVHVDRVLKGKMVSTDEVNIFSENSPTKFAMQVGKQYLLFVHLNYNTYEIDNCGNSGLLQASTGETAKLAKQYARNN
jgi:2-keto-4-pentenoate hydratase/2-oxohepta-3-ene-1,7-dioic acid hydratase in catechol pathway